MKSYHAGEVGLSGDASLVFVNAGALARAELPCCAVLDLGAGRATFFDLDDPGAPFELESLVLP